MFLVCPMKKCKFKYTPANIPLVIVFNGLNVNLRDPYAIFSLPDRGLGNVSVVGPFPRALSLLLETNSQNSKRLSGVDYHYQYVNTPADS